MANGDELFDSRLSLENRRQRLEREMERELARLDRRIEMLDSIPDEPIGEDGEPSVVWFRQTFDRGTYDYAAVRGSDGRWYTTIGVGPRIFSWIDLWQHAYGLGVTEVWFASEWTRI